MTRRLITIKWLFYSLWTLLFLLVQQLVLPYIRIWGVHPFVLPALAAIAASFEGKREGPVFALVLGLICDQLFSGAFPCFYAVTLLLAALVAGLAARRIIMPGAVCSLLVSTAAMILTDLLNAIASSYAHGTPFAASLWLMARELLLSLPVGAWLYGLVFGALRRTEPPTTAVQCTAALEHARIVPRSTATVVVAALCGVYALFFAVQAGEWFAAAPLRLSAPDVAAFAVDGFWELQKILLLNFGVLAGVHFLGRAPLPKALAAVFCGFGLAFAALAAGKLAVYVVLYGLTPRRVIAGWFLGVLAVWCVLALVRVFRAIPAAHIAILVLAVSFTVLACVDMKQRIIDANLARVEAGIDEEPDWEVLWECGYQEQA